VYLNWRTGFEDRRIRLPRNQQMIREAEALLELDRKFDHPPDGGSKDTCLSVNTLILLADGRQVHLRDLPVGSQLEVWGVRNGVVQRASATALGVTRTRVPTLRIWLSVGSFFECTPDHLILRPDGSYTRADQVKSEDILATAHTTRYDHGLSPYLDKGALRVVRVEDAGIQDVGCLRTDTRNFALACGIFVHNSDAAAGAYYNAITSEETQILSSYNAPTVITSQQTDPEQVQAPIVTIPTPPKTYTRLKKYEA
jgi:hypothetical protein